MLPLANRNGGDTLNSPDQCLNRWVNVAEMADAEAFSPNVIIAAGNAITMASTLAVSQGDELDILVYAPTIGMAFFPLGNPKLVLNGSPCVTLMSPVISNDGNTTQGGVATPSPPGNVFVMCAPRHEGAMTAEELEHLARALGDPSGPGRGALLPGEIGYVAIGTFSTATPSMAYAAIRELEAQGMKALIVDLRDNPGGEVTAAFELAGDFLETGTLLGTLRDADGDETEIRARAGTPHRVPTVLLVNRGTASAAELFAGCLQAHGRAVVVGERTYGKGVVQTVAIRPEDGALARVSVATCRLPNGAPIQGSGIHPDRAAP